jgi:transposase
MKERMWVGLDVHAENIVVATLTGDSNVVRRSEFNNNPKAVKKAVAAWRECGSEVVACYEAGVCGFELFRQLESLDVRCDVIAPSLIPKKAGERVKTDKRDAEKLARMLRAGELTAIHVPTTEQESGRDLLRAREDARAHRTAARNQLLKFLLRHGHRFEGKNWSEKFWAWLGKLNLEHEPSRSAMQHYITEVLHLDAQMKLLDEEILKLSATPLYEERVAKLSCFKGIKTQTAMVILTELFDLRRFQSARQLMAYLGLVTSEHSSGRSTHRGSITKTGNAHVRSALVESSWAYARRPGLAARQRVALERQAPKVAALATKATHRLSSRFKRLTAKGKPSAVAIVAVARELAGFIWAMENYAT